MKKFYFLSVLICITTLSHAQNFWRIYNYKNTPDLLSPNNLKVINDNLAFISVSDGVLVYSNGNLELKNSLNSNLPTDQIASIHKNQENVWFDLYTHFAEWNGSDFTIYNKPAAGYQLVAIDKLNRPWFKVNTTVYQFDGTNFSAHPEYSFTRIFTLQNGNIIGLTPITYSGNFASIGYLFDGNVLKNLSIDTMTVSPPNWYYHTSSTFLGNLYLAGISNIWKIDNAGIFSVYKSNLSSPIFNRNHLPVEESTNYKFFIPNTNNQNFFGLNLQRSNGNDTTLLTNITEDNNYAFNIDDIQLSETKIWVLTERTLAIANQSIVAYGQNEMIDVNSIKATFSAKNIFFNQYSDLIGDTINFQIMGGQLADGFFASNFWVGGKDENGEIKVSKNYFGYEDFAIGRVNNQNAILEKPIFKISKSEIDLHKFLFDKPGYNVPENIAKWPGNGNPLLGQYPDAAPFYDVNNNGRYEPQLGDYPAILGDQAVCWFSNDQSLIANNRSCNTMGLEIFTMVFGFDAPNNPALNQTIILRNTIINRSGMEFDSVRIAFLNDFDIGNMMDDYIGCDSINGIGYAYNGDSFDENNGGGIGFLNKIPAVGMKFISHSLHSATYYSRNSITTFPKYYITEECYERLCNMDNNGFPMQNFQFAGDPITNTGETESNVGNTPFDRRNFMTTNIDHFAANERIVFDVVVGYGFAPTGSTNYLEAITTMKNNLNNAADYFISMPIDYNNLALGKEEINKSNESVVIFPNPTNGSVTISANNAMESIAIYSITGEMLLQQNVKHAGAYELSLENFEAGIYILKINESNSNQIVKKIIKQ